MKQKKAAQKHANAHRSTAEYAEWLYTQGLSDDERSARAEQEEKLAQPESRRRRRPEKPKRRHGLRIALVLVLLLTIGAAVFHFLDRPAHRRARPRFPPAKKAARPSSSQARTRAATVPTPCCC